jgi:hypothetical protein
MRRAIETAPRDGEFVLLEDDASGRCAVARWSAETADWVKENGELIQITATHWNPMPRNPMPPDNHLLQDDPDTGAVFPVERPASWARRLRAFSLSSSQAAPRPPVEGRRAPEVRRRVAALLAIATLVIVALLGVSLGIPGRPAAVRAPPSQSEVPQQAASLAWDTVPQRRTDSDGPHLPATAVTTGVALQSGEREQRPETPADELAKAQRTIKDLNLQLRERASELAIARRETETHAAQSSKAAGEKAQLKQAAESTAAQVRELASQLVMARRELDAHAASASKASGQESQVRQAAESTAAELRQSLQQERDKAAVLARDLATARRELDTRVTPAGNASDEAAQIKQAAERTTTELLQSLRQERDRAEVLARDLATARRERDTQATLARNASDQAAQSKQAAENTTTELRQALQQERDRAETLAKQLAIARRELDTHAKLSSKAATEVKQSRRAAAELRQSLQLERDRAQPSPRDIEFDRDALVRVWRLIPW